MTSNPISSTPGIWEFSSTTEESEPKAKGSESVTEENSYSDSDIYVSSARINKFKKDLDDELEDREDIEEYSPELLDSVFADWLEPKFGKRGVRVDYDEDDDSEYVIDFDRSDEVDSAEQIYEDIEAPEGLEELGVREENVIFQGNEVDAVRSYLNLRLKQLYDKCDNWEVPGLDHFDEEPLSLYDENVVDPNNRFYRVA
ncbi:MAG: hypothetical protein SVV03_06755 [Candidatus Nanohaloarchaea archaeon]|nr:hypothetical protein [Candidatus Nanohaloarchaea archaeon]